MSKREKIRRKRIEEIKLTAGLLVITLIPFGMFTHWLLCGY